MRRLLILALFSAAAGLAANGYVGGAVCASCHKTIAEGQARTNMALTWQGGAPNLLPANFSEVKEEGPAPEIHYRIRRDERGMVYRVELPGRPAWEGPVESVVGGKRHGFSYLARVARIEGLPVSRPVLVEARYLHGTPHNQLELSAGFPANKPASYETALGRPLTPEFEAKCLACHGAPAAEGSRQGGVHCESCHGPGKAHLEAVAARQPASLVRAGVTKDTQVCAECHSGFTPLSDPMPEDLLISSQVTALRHSECFLQSAGAINCLQCHDPHADSKGVGARSRQTCGQCHAAEASTKDRCLECHMPVETRGSFQMADHWIRVHPERSGKSPHTVNPRSKFPTRHEYARMMALGSWAKAEELRARALKGESFFELARDNSLDRTKISGGYLGDVQLEQAAPALSAVLAPLRPGEVSPVVESAGKFLVFQRFPRDFRWRANQLVEEASRLKSEGKLAKAAETYLLALEAYPRFLRALIFLGTTMGEGGSPERAAATLEFAAQLYPDDAGARYNLGIAYDALNRRAEAEAAYRLAIEIEPGLTPAYQNLGGDLTEAGELKAAADLFQRGLRENPLSAILYYNLAAVRERQNDVEGAARARAIAFKIDPGLAAR